MRLARLLHAARCLPVLLMALLLAACSAAPTGNTPAPHDAPSAQAAPVPAATRPAPAEPVTPARSEPAPPMAEPLPPAPAGGLAAGAVSRSCTTDADCVVKDVGSCCGYQPACVNTASRPDPAAVKAQCDAQGMSSTCGFQEISACTCSAGQCTAAGDGAAVVR